MNPTNVKYILIALLVITVFFVGLGILSLVIGWTTLDFSLLLNKIYEFTLGILSFFVAFSLGQVYWDWRLKKDKSVLLHQAAYMYINKIQSLALQAQVLLEAVDPELISEIKNRTLLVDSIFDEIENICQVYITIFGQLPLLEDTKLIEFYFDKVQPIISRLTISKHSQENEKKTLVLSELITATQQFLNI